MIQKIQKLQIWKKRVVWVFTALFAVVFFLMAVKLIMPNKEYEFSGAYMFGAEETNQEITVYEGISLPMGTYRVELNYVTDADLVALCNVWDGTVFTGGLRCNGEHLYSGLDKTAYEMWLYESTDDLRVVLNYSGAGYLQTGSLKIVETNDMWTMMMTILLFGAVVVYAGVIVYEYDRAYGIAAEKKNACFFILLITFISSLPQLYNFCLQGADLTYHLQRIEGVKDGLLTGQFPVRLEPKWVYNHGYANGIFYCNTLLYFPAVLRMLGFTITASYNAYCIALNLATSWIAYYCFSRMFKSSKIGIVCSALYTLSIFRMYKLVMTGAVGEGSAVTFLPLVIYGLYRIFTEDAKAEKYKTAWIPLMLGYAGLIQTHVLSCEITAFVTILFCVVSLRKFLCKNVWFEFFKGAAGTVVLTLWYLVPFLDYYLTQDMHIKHVSGRTIQERGLLLEQLLIHFWRDGKYVYQGTAGMQSLHPVGVGLVLVLVVAVFLVLWISGVFKKADDAGKEQVSYVKKTAFMAILLMVMSLHVFPWDRIQSVHPIVASLVSSLQFPNRFLGWGTLCAVLVFGYLMRHFKRNAVVFWILAAAAGFSVTTSSMYVQGEVITDQEYFELYNEEGMGFGYISGAEYLIEGTDQTLLTFARPVSTPEVSISDYSKAGLKAEFFCENHGHKGGYVDLPILLYKGYRAFDDATGAELEVTAGDNNLLRVMVPAGYSGKIIVGFVSPFYWRIAEIITVTGFFAMSGLYVYRKRKVKGQD